MLCTYMYLWSNKTFFIVIIIIHCHCHSYFRCGLKSLSNIMPYYALFSRDLHILDLQWRSPLCSILLWIFPLSAPLLFSMTHYDITMAHDIARDTPLWHNNG